MNQKLNKVVHDPRTGTIYISLRPKTQRRPVTSLEYPGRMILDIDPEGDVYGVRLMGVSLHDAAKILERLKSDGKEPDGGGPLEGGPGVERGGE